MTMKNTQHEISVFLPDYALSVDVYAPTFEEHSDIGSFTYRSARQTFAGDLAKLHIDTSHARRDVDQMVCLHSLSSVLSTMYRGSITSPLPSGILPPGLLYCDQNYLIFERPPSYQNIHLIPHVLDEINYDRHEITTYRLPIPWQVYIVAFVNNPSADGHSQLYTSSVRMLFATQPMTSFDDPVYLPPLNNFYTNADLCRPMYDTIDDIERYSKDFAGVMTSAYDWVWNSGSNIDLTMNIVQYYLQFRGTLHDRTVFSKQDPEVPAEHFARLFNVHSYYASLNQLTPLFRSWEQHSLDEVLELRWPNPAKVQSISRELAGWSSDDFVSHLINSGNTESLHFEEDEEYFYQCDYGDCHCRQDYAEAWNEYLAAAGVWPPAPQSLRDSYTNFLQKNEIPTQVYSPHFFTQSLVTQLRTKF